MRHDLSSSLFGNLSIIVIVALPSVPSSDCEKFLGNFSRCSVPFRSRRCSSSLGRKSFEDSVLAQMEDKS